MSSSYLKISFHEVSSTLSAEPGLLWPPNFRSLVGLTTFGEAISFRYSLCTRALAALTLAAITVPVLSLLIELLSEFSLLVVAEDGLSNEVLL